MSYQKLRITRTLKKAAAALLTATVALCTASEVRAVTDGEMDQARAIAAKYYIRYVNDGAGYLDNWTPASMAELEKKLANNTDRQNFKAFKAAGQPGDYAGWDKGKLAEYWSSTFFADNGSKLDAKGAQNGLCKKQIKQGVEAMKVAAPAAAPAEPAPAAEAGPATATAEEAAAAEAEIAEAENEVALQQAEALQAEEEAQEAPEHNRESSGTWVYIMILGILVMVVVGLVIFASRTMKSQTDGDDRKRREKETREAEETEIVEEPRKTAVQAAPIAGDVKMREKYAEILAGKSEEIRSLTRQLQDMEALAADLKDENRRLKAEVERLRSDETRHDDHRQYQPRHQQPQGAAASSQTSGEHREVYLGRVNSRGVFVRADRHAVDGQSVYKLTTPNGTTGSFTVIKNPLIEEQLLEDPGKWLAGGCFAKDIFDTEGRSEVHTETPGKAVFSDGAWRVERKAKIHYS